MGACGVPWRGMALLWGCLLGLAGCAGGPQVGPQITLTSQDRTAMEAVVSGSLGTRGHAQFTNLHAFSTSEGVLVCGEVHADNFSGGSAGFVHFFQYWKAAGDSYAWGAPVVAQTSGDMRRTFPRACRVQGQGDHSLAKPNRGPHSALR